MNITAYDLASRFVGVHEVYGSGDNPLITFALALVETRGNVSATPVATMHDETAWCSAFAHIPAWLLGLSCPWSLRARSWLTVGEPVELADAQIGYDVVILSRGEGPQPGPEVIDAPGHVGYFAGYDAQAFLPTVRLLAGNQGDAVTYQNFPVSRVLGVRRLA